MSDESADTTSQAVLYKATRVQITRLNRLINQEESGDNNLLGHEKETDGMTEAEASVASYEAQNGTPPPLRGSTTPARPAAPSSNAARLVGGVQG